MTGAGRSRDVAALIDARPLSALQLRIFVLCLLVAVLDGADTSAIAIAAPALAARIGMQMRDFGVVFSAATLGAMVGALGFGPLADRFGRRRVLIVASVLFGAFTLLTVFAGGFATLVACRFLAGIGLGGATPCFLGLASEYAPRRLRATLVSVLWAGFPLGIMLGGFGNAWLVRGYGWPAIFLVGGTLPILLALVMAAALPESLQFLVLRDAASARARRILDRLAPGAVGAADLLAVPDERLPGVPVKYLFRDGRSLPTLLLWVPFFAGFGVLGVVVLWLPTLLLAGGVATSMATGAAVNAFNGLGACIGMGLAGLLVDRFGAARVLGPAFVLGAVCTALLGQLAASVPLAAAGTGAIGLFVGIGSSGAIALAALAYPTPIRGTGIGWAMALGRFGQVALPLLAGRMIGPHGGAQAMLLVMGVLLLLAAIGVLLLRAVTPAARPALSGAA